MYICGININFSPMNTKLYRSTIEELQKNIDNVWQVLHVKASKDLPQVVVPITLEMLNQITDRAVIRTLSNLTEILNKYNEIPSLSRASAAKMLNKTPKTLREWEDRGTLIPVYIEGNPYYRLSDIEALNQQDGHEYGGKS